MGAAGTDEDTETQIRPQRFLDAHGAAEPGGDIAHQQSIGRLDVPAAKTTAPHGGAVGVDRGRAFVGDLFGGIG